MPVRIVSAELKFVFQLSLIFVLSVNPFKANGQASPDALENATAAMAATQICGFELNENIYSIAAEQFFGGVQNIAPGGAYWPDIQKNMERIKALTVT